MSTLKQNESLTDENYLKLNNVIIHNIGIDTNAGSYPPYVNADITIKDRFRKREGN